MEEKKYKTILFDKKDNHFDVYFLQALADTLKDYRIQEMKCTNIYDKILTAYAYDHEWWNGTKLENIPYLRTHILDYDYINTTEYEYQIIEKAKIRKSNLTKEQKNYLFHLGCSGLRYHRLNPNGLSNKEKEQILHDFYNGLFDEQPVTRVKKEGLKKLIYYLLTKRNYEFSIKDNRHKKMSGIIEIPESLYILQLILDEDFEILIENIEESSAKIKEVLSLFTCTKVDELPFTILQTTDKYELTSKSFERTSETSKLHTKVLELTK